MTHGPPADPGALVEERVEEFTVDGQALRHEGGPGARVQRLGVVARSARSHRMTLSLGGLDAGGLARRRLVLGLHGAALCFRGPLRCKTRGDAVRCRGATSP